MNKVLIILSDNNKGKFIAKGFSSAFKELSYFVFEKKVYDITVEEAVKISPDIVFIFWTDMSQIDILEKFVSEYKNERTIFIHCAETCSDIPELCRDFKSHYIFASDEKNQKRKFIPAVNSAEYKAKFKGYNYTITFSGNPAYKNREILLSELVYNFGSVSIFARSFDFYKSVDEIYKSKLLDDNYIELYRNSYKGYVDSPKELSKIYCSSKINLDMEDENRKDINYRCLEITASGGFLIAPYNKNIITRFDDGKEFETYLSPEDLVDKINFYLKNLNLAQLIAVKGRRNTVSNYSFCDRLKVMLRGIYGKDTCGR